MSPSPRAVLGVRCDADSADLDEALARRVIGCSLTPHDVTPTSIAAIVALGSSGVLSADPSLGGDLDNPDRIAWLRALAGAYRSLGGTKFDIGDIDGPVPDSYLSLCRDGIDEVVNLVASVTGNADVPDEFGDLAAEAIPSSWSWACRTLDADDPIVEFVAAAATATALRRLRARRRDWSSPQMRAAATVAQTLRDRAVDVVDASAVQNLVPISDDRPARLFDSLNVGAPGLWQRWRRQRADRLARQVRALRDGRVNSILRSAAH